ncbi:hypothetical protein FOB75_03170 [Vibrio parahaemolyticus]|uniref:hypothetical protein n=1 Tax=Vibrio parahaemolyticus TaxID=670 RepID=UPI00123AA6D1|nr:hypothetical protein [Vibrio parahaemolyticus]QET59986.1 hypothetical protein FOB75_03170 [Vibrio parahaemolyticus]
MKEKLFPIFISILFPIALFLLSPLYSTFFDESKEISYSIVHTRNLLESYKGEDEWSNLVTSFENAELESAYLTKIMVVNSGSEPIKRADFDSSAVISFDSDIEIIGSRVDHVEPSNLIVTHNFSSDHITFDGLLLNPDDNFVFEILSRNEPIDIRMQSRISGISSPILLDYTAKDGLYLKAIKHKTMSSSHQIAFFKVSPYITIFTIWLSIIFLNVIYNLLRTSHGGRLSLILLIPSIGLLSVSYMAMIDGVILLHEYREQRFLISICSTIFLILPVGLVDVVMRKKKALRLPAL